MAKIKVGVLQITDCDSSASSSIKETRHIHNIDGMRTVNYLPAPSMKDIDNLITRSQDNTLYDTARVRFVLTADGYLYLTSMTPGYCDGEITVTKEQLLAAKSTEVFI